MEVWRYITERTYDVIDVVVDVLVERGAHAPQMHDVGRGACSASPDVIQAIVSQLPSHIT